MAEVVYGDEALSAPLQELAALFESDRFGGTLYLGYPILTNVDGAVKVDALYVSESSGVVIFDANHLELTKTDNKKLEDAQTAQDTFFAAINSKLLETPELLERRVLAIPITIITLSGEDNFTSDEMIVSTVENVEQQIPNNASIRPQKYAVLRAVIERTATLRPQKKRTNVNKPDSRGSVLRKIEKNIANLDAWQKRAAIEIPAGPQRIRGLAGSGKTIVLALKAAFLHAREPSWRIVVTFQTRSLYEQFRRLVRQFCFEFSKQEPDWDKITIIHAWGSPSSKGVYSEIAQSVGQQVWDFSSAKAKFGVGGAFEGVCAQLLKAVKQKDELIPLYDAVLIDEGQDLPQAFFELVYYFTKPPKRIIFAYDELQNLSDFSMPRVEDLFGRKRNGHPNVQLRNEMGRPKQDVILPVCYRNTPWALSIAHGLGFGIARLPGLVQMFDEPSLWREIGYEVVSGELSHGNEVGLARSQQATPKFFLELLTPDDAIQFHHFESSKEEFDWLAESIAQNLENDELELDDILIVIPEAITIRGVAPNVMGALRKKKIQSHLVGVTTSRDSVFSKNSVAITSIYRAKGNEAPMVYVVGCEYCYGGINVSRRRNILFTAITRSRAWVRASGVGSNMLSLMNEYNAIKDDNFQLEFRYPTKQQLERLRTLHRDRSSDEVKELEQDLEGLARVLQRLKAGEITLESLSDEARQIVQRLQDENSKPATVRRRTN